MPNRDNPNGFTPRFHKCGGEIRCVPMQLTAANTIVGVGDPVIMVNDGLIDRGATNDVPVGIAAQSAAAASGTTILVYRDPNIVYSAQTNNGSGTGTLQTAVNLNCNYVIVAATNGQSNAELQEASVLNTATLPFKIEGLYAHVDNVFGEFNELLVSINNHKDKGGTGTLGV